ncbi:MAG: hypothetical protein U0Q07_13315 [Acidimicrobiales bacterium]
MSSAAPSADPSRSPAPAVLAVGTGAAGWAHAMQRAGLAGRVAVCDAGAVEAVPDPGVGAAFDLVLVVDVCGDQDGPANERLLSRLADLVRPGSLVLVGERAGATPSGSRWPVASYARWLTDAGFADVRVERADPSPEVLVHAVRRGPDLDEEAS